MADEILGTDLFGAPILRGHEGRGRPEHVRTPETVNRVILMLAMGHKPKEAAYAIGVSVPTLRKHYFSELEQYERLRLQLKAELLRRLVADGSVAAIKELFKQLDKSGLEQLADRMANRQTQGEPKKEKIGKKAAAAEAAAGVRGKFAPPEAPKRLN